MASRTGTGRRTALAALVVVLIPALVATAQADRDAAGGPVAAAAAQKKGLKKKGLKKKSCAKGRGKGVSKAAKRRCKKPARPPAGAPAALLPQSVSLQADPALFPAFDPAVSDYYVRCAGGGDPVTLSGEATNGAGVGVAGAPPATGTFALDVALDPDHAFSFEVWQNGTRSVHHVRCLPTDFPIWNYDRTGVPSEGLYMVTPTRRPNPVGFVVVFDDHGVPVWWWQSPLVNGNPATPAISLADGKSLSGGRLAWARSSSAGGGYQLRDPDGTVLDLLEFQGGPTGEHELEETPDGTYMLMSYKPRATTEDLTSIGGSADAPVSDSAIQEQDAEGNVLWEWNSADHIDLSEIRPNWWSQARRGDLVHMNSIEAAGDSVIVSLRFTDAVYSIDRDTGEIEWKLGGTTTPESLTVLGDEYDQDPLRGQHDARVLGDGTVTVHDNSSASTRPPRAVRFEIDAATSTALLLESVEDPEIVSSSVCCGGVRRTASGAWMMSWGFNSQVTEFEPDGDRAFRLRFFDETDPLTPHPDFLTHSSSPFSYRVVPVPPEHLTVEDLREGMEERFPGPVAATR